MSKKIHFLLLFLIINLFVFNIDLLTHKSNQTRHDSYEQIHFHEHTHASITHVHSHGTMNIITDLLLNLKQNYFLTHLIKIKNQYTEKKCYFYELSFYIFKPPKHISYS